MGENGEKRRRMIIDINIKNNYQSNTACCNGGHTPNKRSFDGVP